MSGGKGRSVQRPPFQQVFDVNIQQLSMLDEPKILDYSVHHLHSTCWSLQRQIINGDEGKLSPLHLRHCCWILQVWGLGCSWPQNPKRERPKYTDKLRLAGSSRSTATNSACLHKGIILQEVRPLCVPSVLYARNFISSRLFVLTNQAAIGGTSARCRYHFQHLVIHKASPLSHQIICQLNRV